MFVTYTVISCAVAASAIGELTHMKAIRQIIKNIRFITGLFVHLILINSIADIEFFARN